MLKRHLPLLAVLVVAPFRVFSFDQSVSHLPKSRFTDLSAPLVVSRGDWVLTRLDDFLCDVACFPRICQGHFWVSAQSHFACAIPRNETENPPPTDGHIIVIYSQIEAAAV